METLEWILDHWEMVVGVVVIVVTNIVAFLRTTAWGKANKDALDTVVNAVENANSEEVKKKVREIHDTLSPSSSDALKDSVRRHDKKKETPTRSEVLKREAMRSIGINGNV